MAARIRLYAEVAVQLPVYGTFHYEVPVRLAGLRDADGGGPIGVDADEAGAASARQIGIGSWVLVPFGSRGVTGVVVALHHTVPEGLSEVRAIDALLDADVHDRDIADDGDTEGARSISASDPASVPTSADSAAVPEALLKLCLWVAEYYHAPPGEVLRVALPVGAQITAQQMIALTKAGREALLAGGALGRGLRDVLGALHGADGPLPQRELLRGRLRMADLAAAVERGWARFLRVADKARVKARTERTAVLVRPLEDGEREALRRAPKQLAAVEALERAGGAASVAALRTTEPRIASHLRALAQAGLVRFEQRKLAPTAAGGGANAMEMTTVAPATPPTLTEAQERAVAAIERGRVSGDFAAYLLHGITGSGKTEVYLHAIANVLKDGATAIVLVPEISLTPQLAARFRARFGERVAVLHSGLSDRERFDEWQRLRMGTARIALGARSAVFAPVRDLAMIVVDEEHDSSFKQEEGVRYNARDVALVRAKRAKGVCILGSATPSLESYYAAERGRYVLLELPKRATARPLPDVRVIDLRAYPPQGDAMLTVPLVSAIDDTLKRGEQVILFLNRRGFDTFLLCRACGNAMNCPQCSVSLTYHRQADRLLCHYCGYRCRVPEACPTCKRMGKILRRGLGTEKVAAAVGERFRQARIARLDRDVVSGARIAGVLGQMAQGQIDILVGTQMVTKGHDFPGVTLVGVLCADVGLSLPDFRASERTFQLLTQVSGRAGRGERPGQVIVQTYRPAVPAVAAASTHDYANFYNDTCRERMEFHYPPYGHLVAVRIDGVDAAQVAASARALAAEAGPLTARLGVDILGPTEAPLVRLKGRTRWHMWLRAPTRKPLRQVLYHLAQIVDASKTLRVSKGMSGPGQRKLPGDVRVSIDVDPVSAL